VNRPFPPGRHHRARRLGRVAGAGQRDRLPTSLSGLDVPCWQNLRSPQQASCLEAQPPPRWPTCDMEIQDETPLIASLLDGLEEDYREAVLHLAWDRCSETKERTLLFAFVELLPSEVPVPIDDYDPKAPDCSRRLGSESNHYIHIRHVVMPARQATAWYLDCRRGHAVMPPVDSVDRPLLTIAELGEEPQWPSLVSNMDESDIIPFCPQWIHCPRTHHLLPVADFNFGRLWSQDERERALEWLAGRLHFDLRDYPEYWGSVHLVAPNPVYRKLDSRLQPRTPPAESVLLRFQPRAGKSLNDIEISFVEQDSWGTTALRSTRVSGPLLRVNLDREVNAVAWNVCSAKRGTIEVSGNPHVFLKSIHMNVSVAQAAVIQGGGESYAVVRSGKPDDIIIGKPSNVAPGRSRMLGAYFERKRRRIAQDHMQRWFSGQKEEARDLLRSLIHEANSQVLLIDPYFRAQELTEFALAVGRTDISIRILSSSKVLKQPVAKGSPIRAGEQLLTTVRRLGTLEGMNPFEVRVMGGDSPDIHDRFLVLDQRIWLLGSSLHDFGSRGTMMVALPDPTPVRQDLLAAWFQSETLEMWIERRRKSKTEGNGE